MAVFDKKPKMIQWLFKRHSLNIGGGPSFSKLGWYNLEAEVGPYNPNSFKLTPDCSFPISDASLHTVYTSHSLEHLDPETVKRVLLESYRVLKPNGILVIKIPDFEMVLEAWRKQNLVFFKSWNMEKIVHTWKSLGVPDDLDYRTALIFCGIWNKEFGSPFTSQKNKILPPSAYHGPPPVKRDFLQKLFTNNSPADIARQLSQYVVDHYKNFHFNHRNAWSREELRRELSQAGFKVETFDSSDIIKSCAKIPGIDNMKEISLYCLARK